jgi:CheY-like chemotaxis protein
VGQLTGGIAHDFNNILGLVIGNLDQLIEVCEKEPEVTTLASAALDAALRGAELVRRLMAFSRNQPLAPKLLDLGTLVRGMEPVLRQTLDERLVIEIRIAEGIWPVLADQAQFENAILNLAINARDAMPDGGRLRITCKNEALDEIAGQMIDLPPGDYVTLTISDTGTGIEPETLSRVFEPFFTTKEVGKGSGLGLSMVYGYALQSGGSVKIYSEVGIGTDIRLCLPRALGGMATEKPKLAPILVATGSERILVVEDKPDVRQMAITLLDSLGYRTVAAENAAAAIGILDGGETFHLLFTDLIMPGAFGGIGLAREFRRRFPRLPIVFTTGFSDPAELQREMAALSASMIVKPYRKAELAACIRAALTQPVVV